MTRYDRANLMQGTDNVGIRKEFPKPRVNQPVVTKKT
jgi:hypothetical protein